MLINVSVVPGKYYPALKASQIDKLCADIKKSPNSEILVIVEDSERKELLRREFSTDTVPEQGISSFCKELKAEIFSLI